MGKLIRERKKISTKKKFFFLFCNDKKQMKNRKIWKNQMKVKNMNGDEVRKKKEK